MLSFALAITLTWAEPPSPFPESPAPTSKQRKRRGYRPWLDGSATAIAGGFFLVTNATQRWTAPRQCRWCGVSGFDSGARRALRWQQTEAAADLSDAGLFVYAPGIAIGLHALSFHRSADWRGSGEDFLVILEAVAITGAITDAVKLSAARERPFAHYGESPIPFEDEPDQNLSFFSGHTSLAFSVVSSAGTLATLRRSKMAPWIWGVGLPMASLTAYFRVAGDRHYLTDVLVGALAGTAIGVTVPLLVHSRSPRWRPRRTSWRLTPAPSGISLTGRW